MSPEEKREIRGEALLEYEEAKADLALLRAKADSWLRLYEQTAAFLTCAKRDTAHLDQETKIKRAGIAANLSSFEAVISIHAALDLDKHIEAAVERMEKAEAAKKRLGFN